MGGKAKQAQRTKNNARPSSSGRSAELLSNSLKDPALFGLGIGKPIPPLFSTLTAVNYEQGLNTEFALCFKKFNKKDPVTRAKALQEFLELTKNGNVDDVVATLPGWAHFYPILTIDTDRKVRECAQACNAAVVRVSGRRMAPHLKRLLPAWLLAQHDAHAPAQHHAHSSITNTFPQGKLGEAIKFCKVEIITLFLDNLMGNADAMLIKKPENQEEKDIQISQIIASSLRALEFFVEQLPPTEDDWLWDSITPLLRAGSFWKLIQNTNQHNYMRAAWFGCAGRLAERFGPRFAAGHGVRAARALLGPCDAAVAAHRWAALLRFARALPEWWSCFEKPELLVKRIVEVVESGGWGDAALLAKLVLPLLALMPQHLLADRFFRDLFHATFRGLERKNIMTSKSERQAWITNLADCLRFLSVQEGAFVVEIVTSVHRTWLERILAVRENQIRNNLIKHSATNMATLFKFWLKCSSEASGAVYDQLLRNCWQNVSSTIDGQMSKLSADRDEIGGVIENHILLLQSLKSALKQEARRRHSIKFADEAGPEAEAEAPSVVECDAAAAERYYHSLSETAHTACSLYFEFARERGAPEAVFGPLVTLLVEFDGEALYAALARRLGAGSARGLYEAVLRPWLLDERARCRPLLEVLFLLLEHLGRDDQDAVFHSFQQLPEEAVEWCLELSTSHPRCGGAGAGAGVRWLRGGAAAGALGAVCRRALWGEDAHAASLLLRCLTHDQNGECPVSEEAVGDAARQLCAALAAEGAQGAEGPGPGAGAERVARVAARCASLLAAAPAPPAPLAPLAAALLRLQLDVPRGDERLSLATWLEVRSSWQDAIACLPLEAKRSLQEDVVAMVHQRLFDDTERLDVAKIENLVSPLPFVLSPCEYSDAPSDCAELAGFTRRLLRFGGESSERAERVEQHALRSDCMRGRLSCPRGDESALVRRIAERAGSSAAAELSARDLLPAAREWLFAALYLRAALLRRSEPDGDAQAPWCNAVLSDAYFREQYAELLRVHAVLTTLYERYAFWPGYEIIEKTKHRLDMVLDEIFDETSTEVRNDVRTFLLEKANSVGYYWAYARYYYETKINGATKERTKREKPVFLFDDEEEDTAEMRTESKTEDDSSSVYYSGTESQENLEEAEDAAEAEILEFLSTCRDRMPDTSPGAGVTHILQAELLGGRPSPSARLQVALLSFAAAHGAEPAGAELAADAARTLSPDAAAELFANAYYRHNHTMLYDRELMSAPWAQVASNAAVLDYLAELVTLDVGWSLPPHHWDFITISLCSLISSLECSVAEWGCTKVAMVAWSALALFRRVQSFAGKVRGECERRAPSHAALALAHEWDDIFAPDVNARLLRIIRTVIECEERQLTSGHMTTLAALVAAVPHLQWGRVAAVLREGPLSLGALAAAAADALLAPRHPSLKLLAFALLNALAERRLLADAELLSQWSAKQEQGQEGEGDEEEGADGAEGEGEGESETEGAAPPPLSLTVFEEPLRHLQELADAALSGISACEESCELVPLSDSHLVALGYLMLSVAVYEQCDLARGDLVHHYIEHFRKHKYADYLMSISLRLLPAKMLEYALDDTGSTPVPAEYAQHFVTTPNITVEGACVASSAGALAMRALWAAVAGPGASGARGWWGALGARRARAARRLAQAFVARPLMARHFAHLQRRRHLLPDAQVAVARSGPVGEARCAIQVEERTLELCVVFSEAHPLVAPRALPPAHPAAPETHWLNVYLAYQNGSLVNAFKMWIRAVHARIESAPQCYICYCRLHPASGKLPTVLCHQCRNKYHPPCLRKWFAASNKSNCPLCRSSF